APRAGTDADRRGRGMVTRPLKVLNVVGARPNFMKVGPVHRALEAAGATSVVVHTGQHYDAKMSDVFFRDLGLPEPDHYLGIGGGTHAEQTARVMMAFEPVLEAERPELVLVVGDVNSTLATALVAAKRHVPVAHVEAGLRSGDRAMPEELNRLCTDALSDLLFVTEQSGLDNLRREGVLDEKVHFVGNVMIDSLVAALPKARATGAVERLGLTPQGFVLMTMHRPSNVDAEAPLREVVRLLQALAARLPIVLPLHPRTAGNLDRFGLRDALAATGGLHLVEPLGYLDFLGLMEAASAVVTDSGGIQEETTFLGVPCVTLRENTERPVTVTLGTNELAPLDADHVAARLDAILSGEEGEGEVPPLWDGHAATRIADVIVGWHAGDAG
ncbi:MAG: UDP-N-acetylglucosamine 2-epimerase (non-hydrolyzing), partial [Rubricoccaceae bacterium]|nr:UDP-N-acetylglucosamine 2-epimerase (non-hydrolyzing) [Rubricoccaceae bacterium]